MTRVYDIQERFSIAASHVERLQSLYRWRPTPALLKQLNAVIAEANALYLELRPEKRQ